MTSDLSILQLLVVFMFPYGRPQKTNAEERELEVRN